MVFSKLVVEAFLTSNLRREDVLASNKLYNPMVCFMQYKMPYPTLSITRYVVLSCVLNVIIL